MTAPTEAEVRAKLHARIAAVPIGVERDDYASWGMEHGVLMSVADARDILALLDEARKDRERLDWYEQQHKLHGAVEVLYVYVVDEYELTITHDGNPVRYVRAPTLRAAIDQARGV